VRADATLHLWPREPSDSQRKRIRKNMISSSESWRTCPTSFHNIISSSEPCRTCSRTCAGLPLRRISRLRVRQERPLLRRQPQHVVLSTEWPLSSRCPVLRCMGCSCRGVCEESAKCGRGVVVSAGVCKIASAGVCRVVGTVCEWVRCARGWVGGCASGYGVRVGGWVSIQKT
jgi:hypothetical protein